VKEEVYREGIQIICHKSHFHEWRLAEYHSHEAEGFILGMKR
jgi:hypothetical protein